MGYNWAVTHYVTPLKHVARHFKILIAKKNRENYFKNVISDLSKKTDVFRKPILEKSAKTKNNKKLTNIKAFLIFGGL